MKRRWNANGLVLAGLAGVLLLAGGESVLRLVRGPSPPPPKAAEPPPRAPGPRQKIGGVAPDFRLPDRSGKQHRLSELVRSDTVLCFTCGCANCLDLQTYMGILIAKMGARAPAVIAVSTMPKEREAAWFRDTRLKQTLLYEERDGPVMAEYEGHPCPRVYRLGADRKIGWVGPAPDEVPSMREVGNAVAENLGFPPGEGSGPLPRPPGPQSAPGRS
jgi:hypothetical protein